MYVTVIVKRELDEKLSIFGVLKLMWSYMSVCNCDCEEGTRRESGAYEGPRCDKLEFEYTGWPRKIYPSKNSIKNNTRRRMIKCFYKTFQKHSQNIMDKQNFEMAAVCFDDESDTGFLLTKRFYHLKSVETASVTVVG